MTIGKIYTKLCDHKFLRDPFTKLFKCLHCNLETDGSNLKEWRK